jgi:hypothetical protein
VRLVKRKNQYINVDAAATVLADGPGRGSGVEPAIVLGFSDGLSFRFEREDLAALLSVAPEMAELLPPGSPGPAGSPANG